MTDYKCKDCGNTEYFEVEGTEEVRLIESYVTTAIVDNEGCVEESEQGDCLDSFDHDIIDTDIDWDSLTCRECGSSNIIDLDKEDDTWKTRLSKSKAL